MVVINSCHVLDLCFCHVMREKIICHSCVRLFVSHVGGNCGNSVYLFFTFSDNFLSCIFLSFVLENVFYNICKIHIPGKFSATVLFLEMTQDFSKAYFQIGENTFSADIS